MKSIARILRSRTLIGFALLFILCSGLAQAMPEWFCIICLGSGCHLIPCPNGGPGFMDAWGNGSLTSAVQPSNSYACDSAHVCQVTTQGVLTAETFFGAGGEVGERQPFSFVESIDFSAPTSTSAVSTCYPMSGLFSVTDQNDSKSTLVMAIQGQACQVGSDQSRLLVNASYAITADSSGEFSGVNGVGTASIFTPTGLSGSATSDSLFPFSFSGNIHFPGPDAGSDATPLRPRLGPASAARSDRATCAPALIPARANRWSTHL